MYRKIETSIEMEQEEILNSVKWIISSTKGGNMKYTIESFTEKLKEKFPSANFEVITFTNMRNECEIKCLECEAILKLSRAENFTKKDRKVLCEHKQPKKQQKSFYEKRLIHYKERIANKYPNEELTIINFTNLSENAIIQCNKCKSIYEHNANSFLRDSKKSVCTKCFPMLQQRTIEIGHKVEYLVKSSNNLELLNSYTKITDNLEFKCKKCFGVFKRMPRVFLETQKCPYCESYSKKKDKGILQKEIDNKLKGEYEILGEYINTNTKTLFRHNDCGFIFKCTPHDILQTSPCPKCKRFNSKGEIKINKILTEKNIVFISQKRFDNLELLSFDFYLPEYNIAIEFQGEQHYMPIKHFGGEPKFLKQVENDNIKRTYCKNQGITLIEIKYTDIDIIEDILSFLWNND